MSEFLPFVVIGLVSGAAYGLAGLGLVLTYKTSGIFNFGYGAVATLGTFLFFLLETTHHVAWPLAAAICVFGFAPLLGLVLELLFRGLDGASETLKVVSTIGLILIVQALGTLWHPVYAPSFPHFLPQSSITVLGVAVTTEQIIVVALALALSAALYWFFRSVRLGIVMRGVVDNPDLVAMSGDDPVWVRRWAWILGTVFAVVAGLMLAPGEPLDGVSVTTLVFGAFGAAAVGRFSSLPLTVLGGVMIGVAGAVLDKYAATISWIGGLPPGLPFVALFVVLIVTPRHLLVSRRIPTQLQVRRHYRAPARVRVATGAATLIFLAVVPLMTTTYLAAWSAALIDIVLFLSLGLLVRHSGQISLCHLAFAAIGAAAFGHLTGGGMSWLPAMVIATLIAVPVGALIAVPAVRVSGVFLALATLGFGVIAQDVFYSRGFMFGSSALGIVEPRPDVSVAGWNLASDSGFYYLLLLFAVLTVVAVTVIGEGRLGRLLAAMADSPLALETQGATPSLLKVIVFCITAALASLAGVLTGMLYGFGLGTYFAAFSSLYLVAIVVIISVASPWYGVIGAVVYTVVPAYIHGGTINSIMQLLFGLGAATAAYGARMASTPARLRTFLDRLGGRNPVSDVPSGEVRNPVPTHQVGQVRTATRSGNHLGLSVDGLSVAFGGIRAVDDVSFIASAGKVTGLIGPNGAGKTTAFNACSGLIRPAAGRILFDDVDISHESASRRARRGLGRTFQRPELFNSLTVRQNVALGSEAAMAGGNPLAQLSGTRRSRTLVNAVAEEALAITGVGPIADVQVGLLTTGQRRLVEFARALAGPFDLILLDEPSSGLDRRETEQFGRVLRSIVRERGLGILLVEHDMNLVREICDYVYVLDFGTLIFEGTTDEVDRSDHVRAAYLGDTTEDAPRPTPSEGVADQLTGSG